MEFVKIFVGPTNVYAIQAMKWIQLEKIVSVRSLICSLRHFMHHAFFLLWLWRKLLLSNLKDGQMDALYFGWQRDTHVLTKIYIAEL